MIQDIYPNRFDNHYLPGQPIGEKDIILHYNDNTLLLKTDGDTCDLPRKRDLPELSDQAEATFLFTLNDVSCFLVWNQPNEHAGFTYKEISFYRTASRKEVA